MRTIDLTRGKTATVDDGDYDQLMRFKWATLKCRGGKYFYATTSRRLVPGKQVSVLMHRVIMNAPAGVFVDHINGDGLDNRRANLRLATRSQNVQNSRTYAKSGYKGAYWMPTKSGGYWYSNIHVGNKVKGLGRASSAEDAARLYDDAARAHFGPYARLNFPGPGEQAALESRL